MGQIVGHQRIPTDYPRSPWVPVLPHRPQPHLGAPLPCVVFVSCPLLRANLREETCLQHLQESEKITHRTGLRAGGRGILANHNSDRGLVCGIHEELLELNNKKTRDLIFKMGQGSQWRFLQRRTNGSKAHEEVLKYHQPLGKCTAKPRGLSTSHPLGWVSSKRQRQNQGQLRTQRERDPHTPLVGT